MAENINTEKREDKGEFREFRELLKKGIGMRTQKEFAEACGIAKNHISRLLSQDVISRPRISTLSAMAKHMPLVTYKELMHSCGYATLNSEELASAIAADVESYFGQTKERPYWLTDSSINELCDTFDMLYCPAGVNGFQFLIGDEDECHDGKFKDAENTIEVMMYYSTDEDTCKMSFTVYYTKTASHKRFIFGARVHQDENGSYAQITPKKASTKETRAITNLMNMFIDPIWYPATYVGYGIPYDKTPDAFKTFLIEHRASFCTNNDRVKLWQRVVEGNENPDVVFEHFSDNGGEEGTGCVISTIMTHEMSDLPHDAESLEFFYYAPSENVEEEEAHGFVMCRSPFDMEGFPQDVELRLYTYARELGLETFGQCYYRTAHLAEKHRIYNTKKYGERLG